MASDGALPRVGDRRQGWRGTVYGGLQRLKLVLSTVLSTGGLELDVMGSPVLGEDRVDHPRRA
jgi:hypothetical protein